MGSWLPHRGGCLTGRQHSLIPSSLAVFAAQLSLGDRGHNPSFRRALYRFFSSVFSLGVGTSTGLLDGTR